MSLQQVQQRSIDEAVEVEKPMVLSVSGLLSYSQQRGLHCLLRAFLVRTMFPLPTCVLLSAPSPCKRLSRSQSTMSGSDSLKVMGPLLSVGPPTFPIEWMSCASRLGCGLPMFWVSPSVGSLAVCLAAVFQLNVN